MPNEQKAYVKQGECDGRYRVYPHHSGMFYLAAYSRQADRVTRMLHGARIRLRGGGELMHPLFVSDEAEAWSIAKRLNVRVG